MFHEIPEPAGQKEKKKKKKRIKRAILRDFQKTSPRDPFTLDAYREGIPRLSRLLSKPYV